jgi:hypothetical protein
VITFISSLSLSPWSAISFTIETEHHNMADIL